VAQASAIFDAFWNSEAVVPLSDLGHLDMADIHAVAERIGIESESGAAQRYLQRVDGSPSVRAYLGQALSPHWSDRIRIVSDPPVKSVGDDTAGWLVEHIDSSLRRARRAALLVSPYFVPGEDTSALLTGLAAQGVHVGVVTNSLAANDVVAVHGGYARYRGPLLEGGVHLYELRPASAAGDNGGGDGAGARAPAGRGGSSGASLHTKAFLVDDSHGFIGSYNLDPRSAYLNTEMGVFFDHAGLAAELRAEYLHLAGPALSWKVGLDADGDLAWLDATAEPAPRLLRSEPGASRWRRIQATVFRWLPLESQP